MTILETKTAAPRLTLLADAASAEISALIARVQPGVVQVQGQGRGGGAGVVWRANGAIMTNHHVIAANGAGTRVALSDGRELPAQLVASDPTLDLALLRVAADDLPAVPVGDSTQLRVGELVFAVGHPWGRPWTVTAGIVSGLGAVTSPRRDWQAQYIRSDVGLAPGNSGGPLLNARGEVVGINAMIFGGDLGVAIPSHVAHAWEASLGQGRAYLGISVQPAALPAALRAGAGAAQESGLLVVAVPPDGPAAPTLLLGDLLLALDGAALERSSALVAALRQRRSGDTIRLDLVRAGVIQTVEVQLGAREQAA